MIQLAREVLARVDVRPFVAAAMLTLILMALKDALKPWQHLILHDMLSGRVKTRILIWEIIIFPSYGS